MSQKVLGGKFLRLVNIIENQPDRLRLIAKMKEAYAAATAITVKDIGGLHFDYTPAFNLTIGKTLRIPKNVVEEFNAQLIENADEGETPDLDSLETLKAQLDHWLDISVQGEGGVISTSDTLEIVVTSGKPEDGRFVYNYTKDGALVPGVGRQKRFTNPRVDINTVITGTISDDESNIIVDDGVVISPSSRRADVIATIIKAAGNPEVPVDPDSGDFEDLFLFDDDVELPMTHYKRGITYTAKINAYALDYHGEFRFKIADLVDNNLDFDGIDNVLSLEFDRPVFYNGVLLGDMVETPAEFFAAVLTYPSDATVLAAIDPADISVDVIGDKTVEITLAPSFFANAKFKTLDTGDKDGIVELPLTLDLGGFESVDEGPIIGAEKTITLIVSSDLVGTATPPFTNQNYTDTVTQAEFAVTGFAEG